MKIDRTVVSKRQGRTGRWIMAAILACLPAICWGAVPVDDYARRLKEACKIATTLAEEDEFPASLITTDLNILKKLLPPGEEIEFRETRLKVDNQWLHDAIDKVLKGVKGDPEQRHSMLVDISDGLDYLKDRVQAGMAENVMADPQMRARLDRILARPDYRPPELQESSVRKFARKIKEFLFRLLEKLFGGRTVKPPGAPTSSGGAFFRVLIILAMVVALLYGFFILFQRFPRRKRKKADDDDDDVREILGEQIAAHATPADLLSDATELGRKGEYRLAIRRAYIAMLFELELRGKLRLNRSKTNRDYLQALRAEENIYPTFSVMTGKFEHIWYGQQKATENEFNQFVEQYRESTRT